MKVLFITTQFPYPLDNGGKIGAINGLDLFRDEEVTLLSFSEQPDLIQDGISFLSRRFTNLRIVNPIIHDIHIQQKKSKLFKTIIRAYAGKYPYLVVKFWNKEMLRAIDKAFGNAKFDIVFIDYLNMQCYGDYIKKKYKGRYDLYILKDHNIEYEITKQMAENAFFVKKMILTSIWKKTKRFEIKAIQNANAVLSVCNENAEYFRKHNPNSYAMLPAFDILPSRHDYSLEDKDRLLYVGNLSWRPNMEGLTWFIEKVYPILKEKKNGITLDVIGSGEENNPFSDVQGIRWHGYVEDISLEYRSHTVFIVPLWVGSGIRIKILEAFNNEIAVVSTSVGCSTMKAVGGTHLLIADDEEQFANAILRLLEDNDLCKKICASAKDYFKENFSIESRIAEFKKLLFLLKEGNLDGYSE